MASAWRSAGGWCRRGDSWELSRFYDELRLSSFDAGIGASLCFGGRVRLRICSRGIYSNLCSPRRVAARATVPHSDAGHPSGLIADPRLRTCVIAVCAPIFVALPAFIPVCVAPNELPIETLFPVTARVIPVP